MKTMQIIGLMAIAWCFVGCEDVVTVDLETAAPRLVIDASIDWEQNTTGAEQKIKLTTTTGYYSATFPTVSGADITVRNTAGTIFEFVETPGTGEYVCGNFEPVIGETYTLTILLNGQTYTATETLTPTTPIEEQIEQNAEGGMAGDEMEITYYHQDDGTRVDYYLYSVRTPRLAFPDYEIEDDDDVQGNLIPVYYAHEDLVAGDVINIKLYGISRRYYEYFYKLLTATGNDGMPFQPVPNVVRGNVVNQTNPVNFAFGYFRLSEVATRSYTIQ